MYIRILVNLCQNTPYQAISRQDTRFRDSSRTDLKTVPSTFEDSLVTLLIWFSPIFMIERLGKGGMFELSKTSVLWFDYLYLVIKIIFTSIDVLVLSRVKFTIVMKMGNESINSYFFKIIWS